MPVGTAKFYLNRCNESPLRGEKPDFWPVSKNNTGSLPLRGNPAGNKRDVLCGVVTWSVIVVYHPCSKHYSVFVFFDALLKLKGIRPNDDIEKSNKATRLVITLKDYFFVIQLEITVLTSPLF